MKVELGKFYAPRWFQRRGSDGDYRWFNGPMSDGEFALQRALLTKPKQPKGLTALFQRRQHDGIQPEHHQGR